MACNRFSMMVTMGVSGSGKSLIGQLLAERLTVPFLEGDDLHPKANVDKMARGIALDDKDRAPWLAAIHDWIVGRNGDGGVVACSALKHAYRDTLARNVAPAPLFIALAPSRATLESRLRGRTGHFMPASLLDSQLATFEPPDVGEHALTLSNEMDEPATLRAIMRWLNLRATPAPAPPGSGG